MNTKIANFTPEMIKEIYQVGEVRSHICYEDS